MAHLFGIQQLKALGFSVSFKGISQPGSAFIFLRWFKLGHISI